MFLFLYFVLLFVLPVVCISLGWCIHRDMNRDLAEGAKWAANPFPVRTETPIYRDWDLPLAIQLNNEED